MNYKKFKFETRVVEEGSDQVLAVVSAYSLDELEAQHRKIQGYDELQGNRESAFVLGMDKPLTQGGKLRLMRRND